MGKRKSQSSSIKPSTDGNSKGDNEVWSKSKKKRMRRLRAKQEREGTVPKNPSSNNDSSPKPKDSKQLPSAKNDKNAVIPSSNKNPMPSKKPAAKLSAMQQAFMARLSGSRFRELNEELYTTESSKAYQQFSSNPELYEQYHDGFRHQVKEWPINPVDVIAKWIHTKCSPSSSSKKKHKKNKQQDQALQNKSTIVIADFGCGDAELAKQILKLNDNQQQKGSPPKLKVHSFDLVASCSLVTACDMAHVPLEDKSVDVGIFCLSLMGTNLADFIREAHRVLRPDGILKIAEVRSRFATGGKDSEVLQDFMEVLEQLGFQCTHKDKSNKMFVMLELQKNGQKPDPSVTYTAKPCIYKRR
mmetsp:Transcript_11398/g.17647  ORF Transcript_11398/g.17647 Transcript_11398/m.17647 type:complete len:357 (-) Transcript_11398:102-1172(-)